MALKAGRVGLNKDLVDDFGYLKEDAPSGEYYTKTQADNKFETKTHVNNNFQKKNLEVPLEMLSGTKLTVESALQGLNEEKQNTTLDVPIEMLSGTKLTVESALQGLNVEKFDRAEQVVLGAKNLLAYPYKQTTKTENGVTFTDNGDGSITINGTATGGNANLIMRDQSDVAFWSALKGKELVLSADDTDTTSLTIQLAGQNKPFYYGGQPFTMYDITGLSYVNISLSVKNGTTVNNKTIYPMLRLASDPDDTYVPYAMTNRDLTMFLNVEESAFTDIVTGASVGSDYGNHIIKFGKIAQGVIRLTGVTATQFSTAVVKIPEGFRPKYRTPVRDVTGNKYIYLLPTGSVQSGSDLSNAEILVCATWIVE